MSREEREREERALLAAPVETLTAEERHARWVVLETRFEEAAAAADAHAAELHRFGARCFELDEAAREMGS